MATVRIRPRDERPVSEGDGVRSRHGLSFGAHYDPERTSFGALVAHNDDELAAGVAYGSHEHRDIEILAWVVDGTMIHTGPDGVDTPAPAGTLQHLVAGTGWHHDERAAAEAPAHLVQVWVTPGDGRPAAGGAVADPPPAGPRRRALRARAAPPRRDRDGRAARCRRRVVPGRRGVPARARGPRFVGGRLGRRQPRDHRRRGGRPPTRAPTAPSWSSSPPGSGHTTGAGRLPTPRPRFREVTPPSPYSGVT